MDLNARLKPGCRIGPYETRRLLGVGYAGEVHLAVHAFTGLEVALKYLHREHLESEHKLSRFSAEATMLFKLDHANVVRVVDAGWDEGTHPWMAMELLDGETLGALLARQGRLSPQLALQYALEIAWGIDAAHEIGVIHRDLKPDNVFVTRDGAIKVLDFSAAKFLTADLRTTRPPEMTCTLAFAPPELLEGQQADPRIDVYSLGLMLWQMLVGRHPFHDVLGKQHALITAHFLSMPESLTTAAGLPSFFDALLCQAIAKPLASRYATMAIFAQAIMKAQQQLKVETDAGRLVIDVAPGEPALPQDPRARRLYQPPEPTPHQDTEPTQPASRVALSSHTWPRAETTPSRGVSVAPTGLRRFGPLGTIPLPVESVEIAVAAAREAMSARAVAVEPTPMSPSPVPTSLPSSRTPAPMATDARLLGSARREDRSRPTLSRTTAAAPRGVETRVLVPALLALALVCGNVTWWVLRTGSPAIDAEPPAPATAEPVATLAPEVPAAAPTRTTAPDPPVDVPVVAPEAPIALDPAPIALALAAPAPAPVATAPVTTRPAHPVAPIASAPARVASPAATPSAAARGRASPPQGAPAKADQGGFVPLFEMPNH